MDMGACSNCSDVHSCTPFRPALVVDTSHVFVVDRMLRRFSQLDLISVAGDIWSAHACAGNRALLCSKTVVTKEYADERILVQASVGSLEPLLEVKQDDGWEGLRSKVSGVGDDDVTLVHVCLECDDQPAWLVSDDEALLDAVDRLWESPVMAVHSLDLLLDLTECGALDETYADAALESEGDYLATRDLPPDVRHRKNLRLNEMTTRVANLVV